MILRKNNKAIFEILRKYDLALNFINALIDTGIACNAEKIVNLQESGVLGDASIKIIDNLEKEINFLVEISDAEIIVDFENEIQNINLSRKEISAINKVKNLLEIDYIKRRNEYEESNGNFEERNSNKLNEERYLDFLFELKETPIYVYFNSLPKTKELSGDIAVRELHLLTNASLYSILKLCLRILDFRTNRFLIKKGRFYHDKQSADSYLKSLLHILKGDWMNPKKIDLDNFAEEVEELLNHSKQA
jgi:hypothetical protein